MLVRKIEVEDLAKVTEIHEMAYDKSHFTSNMSKKKLKEYNNELIKHNEYCFVAEENGNVLGFIIAGDKVTFAVQQFIKANIPYLMWVTFWRPQFWTKKVKAFFLKFKKKKSFTTKAKVRVLSIAVDPNTQSKGLGKLLIEKLESVLIENEIEYFGLSVKKNNLRAIKFYDRIGMQIEAEDENSRYFYKAVQS